MNPFDEKPPQHSEDQAPSQPPAKPDPTPAGEDESLEQLSSRIVVHPSQPSDSVGDPMGGPVLSAAPVTPPAAPPPVVPDDFPVSWSTWSFAGSWLHFVFFLLFIFGVLVVFTIGVAVYSAALHESPAQASQTLQASPAFTVIANMALFLLVFFFLYSTLALLRRRPFWPTLGWKKLGSREGVPSSPWFYFAVGIALAIGVAIVSMKIKTPEHLPIQEIFKNRTGAALLMGMAVLIAPLVEETVFRGYLYPLFASTCARIARSFGADPGAALQTGTRVAIFATGVLFGCLHGAQLGWVLPLVAVLSVVGVVFTYARARADTVLASFLLHLGYNSLIALTAIIETKGFTQMPPHP